MRRTCALLLLLAGLTAVPARAGTASLLHAPGPAGAPVPPRTLLLVLEADPDGVVVRDARVAPIHTKARGAATAVEDDGLLLALLDAAGEPLVVGEVAVPWMLHGPFLGEDGVLHCRGEREPRVTFGAKLPLPEGAASLLIAERGAGAPADAADVLRALRARPADHGLAVRGGGRLADLPGLAAAARDAP
jgi:hypothetical protein